MKLGGKYFKMILPANIAGKKATKKGDDWAEYFTTDFTTEYIEIDNSDLPKDMRRQIERRKPRSDNQINRAGDIVFDNIHSVEECERAWNLFQRYYTPNGGSFRAYFKMGRRTPFKLCYDAPSGTIYIDEFSAEEINSLYITSDCSKKPFFAV
jgi:hypothetical protein